MSRLRTNGPAALFLLLVLGPRLWALDPNATTVSAPAPSIGNPLGGPPSLAPGPLDVGGTQAMPAMMALPLNAGTPGGIDASTTRKFYTITAALRETYDTNVNTAHTNPQTAYETAISPSLLVDFPTTEGELTARYTFSGTYYSNRGTQGNSGNDSSIELSNEALAQYTHTFSSRFSLALAEDVRQYQEPSLYESTGTQFRDGEYISNAFNGSLNAQWTPLFGTQTTYANTLIRYDESDVARTENYVENTGSENLSYALSPTVSGNFGGIVDEISYQFSDRGYTSYTAYVGAQWSVLPTLSVTARGGGSYTQTTQVEGAQSVDSSTISPYAAVSLSWTLGARSTLTAQYSHEVTPNDQSDSNGQQSDRAQASFQYDLTSRVTTHLQGIFTYADTSGGLVNSNSLGSYTEKDFAIDVGASYHFDKYIDLDADIYYSGIDSELSDRNYNRGQFSLGIRGTY